MQLVSFELSLAEWKICYLVGLDAAQWTHTVPRKVVGRKVYG